MTDPFILTLVERDSPLWRRLMGYHEARLKRLRIENDADKTPEATARIRGQIAEVKLMMGLNNDQPIIEPDKTDQF